MSNESILEELISKHFDAFLRPKESSVPGLSMDNYPKDEGPVFIKDYQTSEEEKEELIDKDNDEIVEQNSNVVPTEKERKRIMIDFDGPIHRYSEGFKDGTIYDEPTKDAKKYIDMLKEKFEIYVFTTRVSPGQWGEKEANKRKEEVKSWLKENDIFYEKVTSDKFGALAYIDDNGIHFKDWNSTMRFLKEHIVNRNSEEVKK